MVTISFFALDSSGGSGYLGAFPAGLIVGDMEHLGLSMNHEHQQEMKVFAGGAADLVTLFVFVVPGANLPFGDLGEYLLPGSRGAGRLAPGCAVAGGAGLHAARPARALDPLRDPASLLDPRDGSGAGRAGRRFGGTGVPNIELYASVVALAIVLTLLVQALPAPRLAARLGLLDGGEAA